MAMNLIQKTDGTNQEATILWLNNVKAMAMKMSFDPLEIGMRKLNSMALCKVNSVGKEPWVSSHISGFASYS